MAVRQGICQSYHADVTKKMTPVCLLTWHTRFRSLLQTGCRSSRWHRCNHDVFLLQLTAAWTWTTVDAEDGCSCTSACCSGSPCREVRNRNSSPDDRLAQCLRHDRMRHGQLFMAQRQKARLATENLKELTQIARYGQNGEDIHVTEDVMDAARHLFNSLYKRSNFGVSWCFTSPSVHPH